MGQLQILGMGVEIAVGAGVAVAMLVYLLLRKRYPSLRLAGGPVENSALRRADRAEAELENANRTIAEQDVAVAAYEARIAVLERERSLAAVLELLERITAGVDTMFDKMGELNGSLTHTREGLAEAVDAMRTSTRAIEFLAGQVINRD